MSAGEDDGILGNLPRERPGRRSGKRTSAKAARPAGKPRGVDSPKGEESEQRARAAKAEAAGPESAPRPRRPAAAEERPASRAVFAPEVPGDPVREAARIAGQVAGVGIRTASRIAGGVINRLPRP